MLNAPRPTIRCARRGIVKPRPAGNLQSNANKGRNLVEGISFLFFIVIRRILNRICSNDVSVLPVVFDVTEDPNVSGADTSVSQGPPAATPVHEQMSVPPSTAVPAPSQPVTPATPQVHIVSNARGLYPQLEMFSVPRRSHTIGHTARRGLEDRSRQRIMKKLSEVFLVPFSVSSIAYEGFL
jgi:hypothetical protein